MIARGAVCGVCLEDGRRVVLKVHQPSRTLDFLQAVVRIQRYLVDYGYPCTKPRVASHLPVKNIKH